MPNLPQFIHFSLILPGPQITWKWTMHTDKLTTKCHICLHTLKQGGLMCGIWDWQSTIVKDLNDSQDPKHTLFCRENAFFAIYALFSDNKCPLFTRLGGGGPPKADVAHFFDRFSYMMASLTGIVDCCGSAACSLGGSPFVTVLHLRVTLTLTLMSDDVIDQDLLFRAYIRSNVLAMGMNLCL